MPWLGPSHGIFKLHDSDNWCGSYISIPDTCEILHLTPDTLAHLPTIQYNGETYLSELTLHQQWSSGRLPSPLPPKIANATRSLDELIIIRLLEITLLGCTVESQVPFNRKHAELSVTYQGQRKFIEFVGPSHFIPQYQRPLTSPLHRRQEIEEFFGQECIIWPYWIQRCASNIHAIFSSASTGLASVWSTKAHFGDFAYSDSASLILLLTDRFRALRPDGIGYMYTDTHTNKPVHPILDAIRKGKQPITRLIPAGNPYPPSYWHPPDLP